MFLTPALHRTEPACEAPAIDIPRNCLCLSPTVGGSSVELVGYDADGNVWIKAEVRLDYWAVEGLQKLVDRESRQWKPAERERLLPPLPISIVR